MGERADPAANRARSLLDAPALPQTFRVEPARDTLYGEKPEVYPFLYAGAQHRHAGAARAVQRVRIRRLTPPRLAYAAFAR